MKQLRFTTHARQRLEERFGMDTEKARKLFNKSILWKEKKDGIQLHDNDKFVFVVNRTLAGYYVLLTIYEKGEYDPALDPKNQA